MILSGPTIRRIGIITPHEQRTRYLGLSYGESYAGYDIRLGSAVEVVAGCTTLGISLERFEMPRNVVGRVHDKSTWAREGLQMQNTIIEPGWAGYLTLELSLSPLFGMYRKMLTLDAGTPIAQVIFEYVDCETPGYDGKYQNAGSEPQGAIWE